MGLTTKDIITIAVALMIIAVIIPMSLGLLAVAGEYVVSVANATGQGEAIVYLSDVLNPAVLMILTTLLPILAVIGIAVSFIRT